ncbi:MAG: glycosyltransferase family 4 protein [Gemmatimonadaceae bacterium]|nr:glycosyltransferase family 4 protein [Gemmatimonadaceae bacterium]
MIASDRPSAPGRRILLVAPSLRYLGGQAVQARRLRDRLVTVPGLTVDLLPVDPVLPGALAALQRIKYVRTVVTSIAYAVSLLRTVPRYDVIQAFSASYWSFLLAPVPAILAGRLFGKRVLVNYRSGEAPDHLARWGWHAIPLLRLAHEIVVPSGYLVEVFARSGLRARSVLNFLELDRVPYRRRDRITPRCLSNRNFEAHYNVAQVLEAFALIQREHPDASLTVVGDGPLRESLHARAASLALRNVTFTGAVPPAAMGAHYDAADLYLNAPLIDNMPNSVIEAFAAGLPVVTSDAGGIPWIVRDGENGVLVPAGDAAALAAGALSLLADPARALALADAARREALERYTWDAVRPAWLAVYGGDAAADASHVAPAA